MAEIGQPSLKDLHKSICENVIGYKEKFIKIHAILGHTFIPDCININSLSRKILGNLFPKDIHNKEYIKKLLALPLYIIYTLYNTKSNNKNTDCIKSSRKRIKLRTIT